MISLALKVGNSYYEPELHFARHETHAPGPVNTWHRHAVYHVVYVTQGKGLFRINDQTIEGIPGTLLMINPLQWHQFFAGTDAPLQYVAVSFELVSATGERCLADIGSLFAHHGGTWHEPGKIQGPLRIPKSIEPDLRQVFETVVRSSSDVPPTLRPNSKVEVASFLAALGHLLQRVTSSPIQSDSPPPRPSYRRQLVERALTYINEHFSRSLSLEEMAAQVHLHPVYFAQVFKDEVGLPPRQCLLKIRLNHARKLLVESDMPIGEIAYQCGFRTIAYFSRAFRDAEGMSPTTYRRLGARFRAPAPLAR